MSERGGEEGEKGVLDSTGWEKENVWIEEGKVTLIYTRLIGTRAGLAPEMHSTELQHGESTCVFESAGRCVSLCVCLSQRSGGFHQRAKGQSQWCLCYLASHSGRSTSRTVPS